MARNIFRTLYILLLSLGLSACDKANEQDQLAIYVCDNPAAYSSISLYVDRLEVRASGSESWTPIPVTESHIPLLTLVNGTMQEDIKYTDGVGEESLNRFDDKLASKRRKKNKNKRSGNAKPAENAKPAATGKPAANAPSPAKPAPKPAQPANRNANPQGQPRKQNGNRQPNKPKPKNPQPQTPKTEQ